MKVQLARKNIRHLICFSHNQATDIDTPKQKWYQTDYTHTHTHTLLPKNRRKQIHSTLREGQKIYWSKYVNNKVNNLLKIIIFTNLYARAGYDTRSIFKRSLTGLNSQFSFS